MPTDAHAGTHEPLANDAVDCSRALARMRHPIVRQVGVWLLITLTFLAVVVLACVPSSLSSLSGFRMLWGMPT